MAEPPPSMSTSLQLNKIPKGGYKVTVTGADGTVIWRHESEHPSQITLNIGDTHPDHPVENAIPATTFPKFNRLPPEIRVKIWEFSLNQPRIFWPKCGGYNELKMQAVNFAHKPPSVRQVCWEARKVSDRRGRFSFGWGDTHLKSLWFDFHSDILFDDGLTMAEFRLPYYVRNVAKVHDDARELTEAENLQSFLGQYPDCQKIIFVWSGGMVEPDGDVKFYPMHDDEPLGRGHENWKVLKARINRAWRKKRSLKECNLTEDELPIIEAVECTLVEKDRGKR